jgi:hypothetical protein
VFGDHTYTDEGTYDIAVTITEESATTTFHTTATMVDELLPDSSRPSVPAPPKLGTYVAYFWNSAGSADGQTAPRRDQPGVAASVGLWRQRRACRPRKAGVGERTAYRRLACKLPE